MAYNRKDPLRKPSEEERSWLERISRSQSEPAAHVIRAKEILYVAEGASYGKAARLAGRKSGDAVCHLVKRFNQEGLNAIQPRHGGGPRVKYGVTERERILREVRRQPEPEKNGTATWSVKTLCQALQKAPDGLPEVSLRKDSARLSGCERGASLSQFDPLRGSPLFGRTISRGFIGSSPGS